MPIEKGTSNNTLKITAYTTPISTSSNSLKRTSSHISPPPEQQATKKKSQAESKIPNNMSEEKDLDGNQSTQLNIEKLIVPIMQEFKSLKDSMELQQGEMSEGFKNLKTMLKEQKSEIVQEINVKVDHNREQISHLMQENIELKKKTKSSEKE